MIAAPPHLRQFSHSTCDELRGSNSLHLGFDNRSPKLAPYIAARTSVERRVYRVRTMLRPVRPAVGGTTVDRQARGLAMKCRWTLFAFPRPMIQRPTEMTGAAGSCLISNQAPHESVRSISAHAGRADVAGVARVPTARLRGLVIGAICKPSLLAPFV